MPSCIELGAKVVASLFCWATNERARVTPTCHQLELVAEAFVC